MVALGLLLSGCAIGGSDPTTALQQAQANAAASAPVAAASLEDAQAFGAGAQPGLCIADYTTALTAYPNLVTAYTGRAGCYLALGRGAAAAVHDLDRAVALSPNTPSLYISRAVARRAAGDPAGAIADYRTAASIPSAPASAFLRAIDGLISLTDTTGAQSALGGGRSRYAGSALLHIALADFDLSTGRDAEARSELVTAVTLATVDQDRLRALTKLCDYDVIHHAYQTAIGECTQAVTVNANGAGAYDDRSVAELALGEPAKGVDDLTRAIGVFDGNVGPNAQPSGIDGFGLALLLEARGRAEVESGLLATAAADFRSALAALPPGTTDFAARLKGELEST
jgi:tetratricopeptide (TPR) repeat protein